MGSTGKMLSCVQKGTNRNMWQGLLEWKQAAEDNPGDEANRPTNLELQERNLGRMTAALWEQAVVPLLPLGGLRRSRPGELRMWGSQVVVSLVSAVRAVWKRRQCCAWNGVYQGYVPNNGFPKCFSNPLVMLHLVNVCGKMCLPQSFNREKRGESGISFLWNWWGGNQMWFCAILRADALTWECLSEGCYLLFLVMCNIWIIFRLWTQWYHVWNVSLVQSAFPDASEDFLLAETAFPCFVCSVYACAFAVQGYFRQNKASSLEDGICGCHLWRLIWLFTRAHNVL